MLTGRFQEFASDWQHGEMITNLVPIDTIDIVPIAMFVVSNDDICPPESIVQQMRDEIGDAIVFYKDYGVQEGGHEWFANDNSNELIQDIIA